MFWGAFFAVHTSGQAASYSWTNTQSDASGFWTNGVLWNSPVTTYPGGGDSAYLTNQFSGTETNILNAQLGGVGPVSTLAISNSLGETWLIVTNGATLTNATDPDEHDVFPRQRRPAGNR